MTGISPEESGALSILVAKPPTVFLPNEKAGERFFGFFTSHIRNRNTRRAYFKAAWRFSDWCEGRGLDELAQVKPAHVAAYIEMLGMPKPDGAGLSKPSVKQHSAALRMLFDWLVVGHVLDTNPAHAVRGPKYSQKKGRTPVLDRDEARALLAGIDVGSLTGLRDRALIGIMIYTFARVGAVLQMNVADYFTQGRRGWVRLHEKGGKEHEAPCHHKLEAYLDEHIVAAGIGADKEGPLFPYHRPLDRDAAPHDAAGRLPDDRAPREAGRHQDENRQSFSARYRHHRLPQKRRLPGGGPQDGEPRRHAHHAALRPARRYRLARGIREGGDLSYRMKAAYCLNGHFVTSLEHPPTGRSWTAIRNRLEHPPPPKQFPRFCSQCGVDNISACQHCQAPIEYVRSRPAYCGGCGKAYPWQAAAIENLRAILQEAELSTEDREEIDSALPDVVRDTPKSESAALSMKRVLGKIGKPLYDIALKVVTDVASETTKKTLGLK